MHLTPKGFELLSVLIAAAPGFVTKAELHAQLWPDSLVSDATLTGLIKELRRSLEDADPAWPMIRTVHWVGCAFCAGTEETHGQQQGQTSHWLVVRGRPIVLPDGENVIGRDPAADVWLDALSGSRSHSRIVIADDRITIEDLESKNGTAVDAPGNGTDDAAQRRADHVRLGHLRLSIVEREAVDRDSEPKRHKQALGQHAAAVGRPGATLPPNRVDRAGYLARLSRPFLPGRGQVLTISQCARTNCWNATSRMRSWSLCAPKPFAASFPVGHRADAVALDATRADLCHVGGAGEHGGQRRDAVDSAVDRLDDPERLRVEARRRSGRPDAARCGVHHLDRGIVDERPEPVEKARHVLIRQRTDIERRVGLGGDDVAQVSALEDVRGDRRAQQRVEERGLCSEVILHRLELAPPMRQD